MQDRLTAGRTARAGAGKLRRVDRKGQLPTRDLKAPKEELKVAYLGRSSNSYYVDGVVNSQSLCLLLDTGATMTILSSKSGLGGKKIQPSSWTLKTATGEPARVHGETVAAFIIGGRQFSHRTLVADIDEDAILGLDVMTKLECKIDLKNGILSVGNEEVILRRGKDISARVRLLEETTIPALSQMTLQAATNHKLPEGQCMVLEPAVDDKKLARGIIIARTLFQTGETLPVRLMNINSYPVTLKEGTEIGCCSTVASVVHQLKHNSSSLGPLPAELKTFVERSCQDVTQEEAKQVRDCIARYQDIFETATNSRGRTNIVQHKIDTGDAKPIRQAPRRLPIAKRGEAAQIIKDMEAEGVIEPSNSPWTSPVVLVKKKDGSSRFCVDYRLLNNITKKDSYPLPRIDDTLDTLGGCRLFSTLDLKSGYWQVGMAPEDKEKTAFSIGTGLWQFTVMPFGLCNAPATFERLMESVLRGLSLDICLVYLDDIIVLGRSFAHQLKNLELVFERLRAANLKLNPKKCNLFRKRVNYLGHVVSDEGISVDPEKTRAICEWPVPRNKHEVRSFLGLCTYYRRYVKGFANVAKPLTRLTEEKRIFEWNSDCQDAFEELKKTLVSAPILGYPRTEGKFILDTDASNTAIGGVLSQLQDGEERVIAYFSKVLSKPERNYCVTRRELLAVVKSIEHFHKYLYGRHFLLRTDHAALMWLLRFKSPEGQVARWIERLQEYDYESVHRSGTTHRNADALSRRPCPDSCKHCLRHEERMDTVSRITVVDDRWTNEELAKDQEEDPDLKHLMAWKRSGTVRPSWQDVAACSRKVKSYWAQWNSISLVDGVLKRAVETPEGDKKRLQIILPKKRIPDVLQELHEGTSGGHFGVHRTLERARERFYWANLKEDVKDWCRRCLTCGASNGPNRKKKASMRLYNVGAPFERIAIDVAGPFPTTDDGNKFILVAMDYFSKWVEAYALPNQEAVTVADVLVKNLVSRFGVPLELHSDQGRNFESAVFTRMCDTLGIKKTRTTPLHPQSDGMVERMNRTMGRYLSKVVSDHQRDWDQYLHLFLLAYRSSVHESTGHSPANILFGRELRLPCDLQFGIRPEEELADDDYVTNLRRRMNGIHEEVRSNLQEASERMKERYDVKAEKGGYHPGDLVWLHNPKRRRGYSPKLQSSWEGPYEVITRLNDVVYRIKMQPKGKPRIIHFNRLAPFKGATEVQRLFTKEAMEDVDSQGQLQEGGIKTINKDLFTVPKEYALAHCVAADLKMSRGIATAFRRKFGKIDELQRQDPTVGKALHIQHRNQHLFYLVTKDWSYQKPTYESLRKSLLDLRKQLLLQGLKKLAIPRIGCGLDGLAWNVVRKMIEDVFKDEGISILICNFTPWANIEAVLGQNSLKEGVML